MAEIVNTNVDLSSELEKVRKDAWNHKTFSELYRYNEPVLTAKTLSKMPVSALIANAVAKWKELDLTGVFNGAFPDATMDIRGKKYPWINMALNKAGADEDAPKEARFSAMEIVCNKNWDFAGEDREQIELLNQYIALGLYPLVSMPMSVKRIYQSMETYDDCRSYEIIGTIVNFDVIPTNEGSRYVSIVMWDPAFTTEYRDSCYGTGTGVLKMSGAIMTPDIWKDVCKDIHNVPGSFMPNFCVPVFSLELHANVLNALLSCPTMRDMVDELLISGQMELGFNKFVIDKLAKVTHALTEICAITGAKVDEDFNVISAPTGPGGLKVRLVNPGEEGPEETPPAEQSPDLNRELTEWPTSAAEPEVPVEDARDEWTSFMRGLDEAPVEGKPVDIYSGMVAESLEDGLDIG